MIGTTRRFLPLIFVLLASSPAALSATLVFTLGSATPSFTDGQIVGTATFNSAVAGNPAPFNGFIGSDVSGPNFAATWAYNYAALAGTITSATLTLGLYDHDSQAPGNQVGSFTMSGTDLSSPLNAALEGHGGASGEYDIYTITLPATTFLALAGGTPGLSLALQGPGLGILGPTTFNGAGLDFSTLSITTETTPRVPEPATSMLLVTALALLEVYRRSVAGKASDRSAKYNPRHRPHNAKGLSAHCSTLARGTGWHGLAA